jgi:3-hydroxymyristoyl/3-hydroxydecanoyl-(acyl carrier protein) dehydratase
MINVKQIFKFSNIIKNDAGFKVSWLVSEDLPYFKGHFPNNPILPAIALLDFIKSFFVFNNPTHQSEFKHIKSAKFCEVIKPNDKITADFVFNSETNYWTGVIENQNDQLVSKIRFQLS